MPGQGCGCPLCARPILAPELQTPEEAARRQAAYRAKRFPLYVEIYGEEGALQGGRDTGIKK